MVTRKITGSAVNVTGTTPSGVEYESHLEEDFLALVRFDHRVEHFERWQEKIVWFDKAGEKHTYTPDFFIRYKPSGGPTLKPEVVEVKPDFEEEDQRPKARLPRKHEPEADALKWAAAERLCKRRGFRFLVMRESQICTPYLTNARFLMSYLERGSDNEACEAELIAAVRSAGRLPMGELVVRMRTSKPKSLAYRPVLYRLIATRRLEVDLTERLTDRSMVGLPS